MKRRYIGKKQCTFTKSCRSSCKDSQCLQGGTKAPQGAIIPYRQRKLPKWTKWALLLPDMQRVIDDKLAKGCDICYTDGSKLDTVGVAHAGFGLWYGPEDARNKRLPKPPTEKQSI